MAAVLLCAAACAALWRWRRAASAQARARLIRAENQAILDPDGVGHSFGFRPFQSAAIISALVSSIIVILGSVLMRNGYGSSGLALGGAAVLAYRAGPRYWAGVVSRKAQREINFNLPVVIERVVLAAQAGLDAPSSVIAAAVLGPGEGSAPQDPVSNILAKVMRLSESGVLFEDALKSAAEESKAPAIRHAFAQLAIVHRNGGEVAAALRELGDSVQSLYELSVEEEIARMPVKATLPLVIAFAGLLISFITVPLVQLSAITKKSTLPNIEISNGG